IREALKGSGAQLSFMVQHQPRGLAHAVQVAWDFLGQEPFVLYLGDNLLENGIADFVARFDPGQMDALILLTRVSDPRRFGVAVLDGEQVVQVVEKPQVPPSQLAICGVYVFTPAVHQVIATLKPSARGELEITHAIAQLVEQRRVQAQEITGWWKDTGLPLDLLEANQLVLDGIQRRIAGQVDEASQLTGRVAVEEGAEIVRSRVRGPAIIGAGAKVIDSYIGPYTAIGAGVVVEEAEVEYSIVDEGSQVVRPPMRIHESLLGRGVEISGVADLPLGHRLVLGDGSVVRLGK
ncbi:MAG: glucose-1-phosphate thymidylyltransferase, partial [Deinococcus sp.]|nr:glucose-1-phosphate thymidylyltransferase [Deinococcus sp.]